MLLLALRRPSRACPPPVPSPRSFTAFTAIVIPQGIVGVNSSSIDFAADGKKNMIPATMRPYGQPIKTAEGPGLTIELTFDGVASSLSLRVGGVDHGPAFGGVGQPPLARRGVDLVPFVALYGEGTRVRLVNRSSF